MNPHELKQPDSTDCQHCRDHFGELLYAPRGEPVDEALASSLSAHLRKCSPCAAELRELRQAQSWLDVLRDEPAAGVACAAGPQVTLYARLVRLRRARDAWRYAAAAASVAAAVFLAVAWWNRAPSVDPSPGTGAQQASATTVAPYDWGPEFQRIAQRLDEQGQVLRLLADDVRSVEGRQSGRLTDLEKQAGHSAKASDLQSLRVKALEHDIDKLREFLTLRTGLAQQSAGGAE